MAETPNQLFTSTESAIDASRAARTLEGNGNTLSAKITVNGEVTDGQIYFFSVRYIRVLVPGPLALGAKIRAEFDGCVVEGEVEFCQKMFGGYRVGFELINRDGSVYRREPRFAVEGVGTLSVLGQRGPKDLKIRLADVSASGVGIYVDEELSEQTCVYLRVAHSAIFGEVRHCEAEEGRGFRVGVHSDIFVPESAVPTDAPEAPNAIPPQRGGLLRLFEDVLDKVTHSRGSAK